MEDILSYGDDTGVPMPGMERQIDGSLATDEHPVERFVGIPGEEIGSFVVGGWCRFTAYENTLSHMENYATRFLRA